MFFARGYKTPQSGFCTLMTDAQACKNVPYFSSPDIFLDAQNFSTTGKSEPPKPPERLGTALHNNAEWIKQNRFILENVGNESMKCPINRATGFMIEPELVECIIKSSLDSDPCLRRFLWS